MHSNPSELPHVTPIQKPPVQSKGQNPPQPVGSTDQPWQPRGPPPPISTHSTSQTWAPPCTPLPATQHSAAPGPFHLLFIPCNSFQFCVHRLPSPFPLALSSNIDSAASRTSLNRQLTSVSAPLPGSFFSWHSSASETLHTEPSGFFVYHLSPTPGGEPRGGRDLCLFDKAATVLGSCTYQGPGLWWEFQKHCLQGGQCLLEHSHTSCPLTCLLGQSPLLSSPWPGELGPQHWPLVVNRGAGHQGHWAWTAWLGLVPDFITIRPQRPPALA